MSHTGLISEYVFSRKFGYIMKDNPDFKEITIEGFRRLGINQEKMDELVTIYESRLARKEEFIEAAERNYLFSH